MKKVIRNIILIVIVLGIAAVYSYGTWGKNIYIQTASSGDNRFTNELIGNVEIAQTFLCPYDGLDGVKFKMMRVGTEGIEGYTWRLCDEQGKAVADGKIDESILNNKLFKRKKFIVLNLPQQKDSKGKEYTFYITGKAVKREGCLQAYISDGNQYAKKFTADGKATHDSMVLKMNISRFNIETFLVFLGLVVYVVIFFKFMYKLFR